MKKEDWIVELTENDDEIWSADIECDSREDAIAEGMKGAIEDGLESFRIGRRERCRVPKICAETIIENAIEDLSEEVGEAAESYLDETTNDQEKELEEELNEVFWKWHKKYNLFPNCYKLLDDEVIEVNESE